MNSVTRDWSWIGLLWVPPEVAAIVYRWFGNDGPWAEAKKLSDSANSSAHRQ